MNLPPITEGGWLAIGPSSVSSASGRVCIVSMTGAQTREEYKANQRAIAATPATLRALNRLVECPDLNLDELEPETQQALEEARAALVKAGAF